MCGEVCSSTRGIWNLPHKIVWVILPCEVVNYGWNDCTMSHNWCSGVCWAFLCGEMSPGMLCEYVLDVEEMRYGWHLISDPVQDICSYYTKDKSHLLPMKTTWWSYLSNLARSSAYHCRIRYYYYTSTADGCDFDQSISACGQRCSEHISSCFAMPRQGGGVSVPARGAGAGM